MRLKEYLQWKKLGIDMWWDDWREPIGWFSVASILIIIQAIPFYPVWDYLLPMPTLNPELESIGIIFFSLATSSLLFFIEVLLKMDYDEFKRDNPKKEKLLGENKYEK